MKNKNRLVIILMTALILFSFMNISAFAENDAVFEKNYIIDSKDFYAKLPENFKPHANGEGYYYCFSNGKNEYIYIYRTQNKMFSKGVKNTDNADANTLYNEIFQYIKNEEVLTNASLQIESTEKEKINGLWCFNIEGTYKNLKMDFFGREEVFDFITKAFASRDYIYLISIVTRDKEISQDNSFMFHQFIKDIRINGPYLPEDNPTVQYGFLNPSDFEDDLIDSDSKFYMFDDTYDFYGFDDEEYDSMGKIIKGVVFIFCIPTIIVIIALIIMIIKFIQKVRIVNEYKAQYGEAEFLNINYNQQYNVNQNIYNDSFSPNNFGNQNPPFNN